MHSDSFLVLSAEETDLEDIGHGPFPSSSSSSSSSACTSKCKEALKQETWLPQLAGDRLSALKNPCAFSLYLLISAFNSKSLISGIGLSGASVFL